MERLPQAIVYVIPADAPPQGKVFSQLAKLEFEHLPSRPVELTTRRARMRDQVRDEESAGTARRTET